MDGVAAEQIRAHTRYFLEEESSEEKTHGLDGSCTLRPRPCRSRKGPGLTEAHSTVQPTEAVTHPCLPPTPARPRRRMPCSEKG